MTPNPVRPSVIALDLERTLIDDALSGCPRPGLSDFLDFCLERFDRVVLFTTIEQADAVEVLNDLTSRGAIPSRFLDVLQYVDWTGEFKDLTFVPGVSPGEVVLVDDDAGWVRPDQRECWVVIAPWEGEPADRELSRVRRELERRLGE